MINAETNDAGTQSPEEGSDKSAEKKRANSSKWGAWLVTLSAHDREAYLREQPPYAPERPGLE